MLVLNTIYLDLIVKKEKCTYTFEKSFSYFKPFGVWSMTRPLVPQIEELKTLV